MDGGGETVLREGGGGEMLYVAERGGRDDA